MDNFRHKPVNRLNINQSGAPSAPGAAPGITPAQRRVYPPVRQSVQASRPAQSAQLTQANQPVQSSPATPLSQDVKSSSVPSEPSFDIKKPKRSRKKAIIWSLVGLLLVVVVTCGLALLWYQAQLAPVDSANTSKQVVEIKEGSAPSQIAELLEDEGLINNQRAFLLYTRLEGVQNKLQAGTYRLAPSESTQQIVGHLVSGKVDTFSLTFLPGSTLNDNRKVLIAAGYSSSEVDAAFAKAYNSPLFATKPATADLEGYIYGETYSFGANTSVEAVLEYIFEYYNNIVVKNDLVSKYEKQGLTLFEGITLASIVQREASPNGSDMPDIAQVFYNRLEKGIQLGSDVTYQYIADKTGVARDTNLDSPYNTRRYAGLPPGPIATPGLKALLAVANPSDSDYLFFLSGDDDITYFGRTIEEHEANIRDHCQLKCQII